MRNRITLGVALSADALLGTGCTEAVTTAAKQQPAKEPKRDADPKPEPKPEPELTERERLELELELVQASKGRS